MLTPVSFAFHVTYTCPLACAHCCFSSSPSNRDRLPVEHIVKTIRQLDHENIRMVAFTGGEPFLLGKGLVEVVRTANDLGFVTRIVTSAYFGKTPEIAHERLDELRTAGLDELSISWDDYHEEFVEFTCVHNVFWAAKKLGILTAVNIVQDLNSKWTRSLVSERLGLAPDNQEIICESPLNKNGNAERKLAKTEPRDERLLGPCPYVLTGPTLSAKNKLLACCGVIPNTDALVLDQDFIPERLESAIQAGLRSPLLNWLYLRGPYAIMAWIAERYGVPVPDKQSIGGNCEACSYLFNTKALAEKVDAAASEKADEIWSELHVLDALGMTSPHSIQALWAGTPSVIDISPRQPAKKARVIPIASISS